MHHFFSKPFTMFFSQGPAVLCLYRRAGFGRNIARRFLATKSYDPLRILFCGSDEFSIASLKALHAEHVKRPDLISSIDVVCRPGKRVGRGMKKIREVPIKAAATELSLPVHEVDTFRGWTPPTLPGGPINLIVAVSFGLFVPPRILNGVQYGGLNVHPSLLPDFRGPAPLHHTLLAGRTTTGVTLQTLHLKHFDHGVILAQTPSPGFEIPEPESCSVEKLLDIVSPKGAEILVDGIRKGLFAPPLEDAGWRAAEGTDSLIHAAKIQTEDRHIDWANWTWLDISRRNRVLGPLWCQALVAIDGSDGTRTFEKRRVIVTDMEEVEAPHDSKAFSLVPGLPFVEGPRPTNNQGGKGLYVFTQDGKLVRVHQMKVEGQPFADGLRAALKARMVGDRRFTSGASQYTPFYNPLQ